MIVRIERFAFLPTATMGRLKAGGFECWTLERAWLDNAPNKSCIPDGFYECEPFSGVKFKDVVEVTDVPGRSYILFHAANLPSEIQGCIAPGLNCHFDNEEARVWNSRKALAGLFDAAGKSFCLQVSSVAAALPR